MGLTNGISKAKDITFDSKLHKYYYDNKELTSVTTWLSEHFVPEFNALYASINKAKKNKAEHLTITNPMTLRKYWRLQGERASLLGSSTHAFVELYHLDKSTCAETGYEKAAIAAYDNICAKWDIIDVEKIVWSTDFMLAGCVDMILCHKETGEKGLLDWKTTTDMHKSYNNMLNEMKGVKASALNKYALQLEVYDVLGEIGASHTNRFVVQLKNDGTYKVYSAKSKNEDDILHDYSTQIRNALHSRKMNSTHKLLDI